MNNSDNTPFVDFSFVYEMGGDDTDYIYNVISLYLSTFPEKLSELEKQVQGPDNYEVIEKQAHFLKSGSSVIKIRGMYDDLVKIEKLAKARAGKDEIIEKLSNIMTNFNEALPILVAEQLKNNPANK